MRQTKLTPRIVDAEFEVVKGPDAPVVPIRVDRVVIRSNKNKRPGPRNWFEWAMYLGAIGMIAGAAIERAVQPEADPGSPSPPGAQSQ